MKTKNVFFSILAIIGAKLGYDYFTKKSNSNNLSSSNLDEYIVTKEFSAGVIPNSNGLPNVIVKLGEKVKGKITTQFIYNQNLKGLTVQKSNGIVFIPVEFLKNLDGSSVSV